MKRLIPTQQEMMEAVDEASQRIPALSSWGFFCRDQVSPVSSIGMFCWFDSQEEMFAFMTRYPLLLNTDLNSGDEDTQERDDLIACTVANTLKSIGDGTTSTECGLQIINAQLDGIERIEWWGPFKDLLTENTQFCKQVRLDFACERNLRDYLEINDRPTTVPPPEYRLEASEMEDFIEFLRDYGL